MENSELHTEKTNELDALLAFGETGLTKIYQSALRYGEWATAFGQSMLNPKTGRISMLFIAGIIYSILGAPYHDNCGCVLRTDCPLCKFAIDSSSCDSAANSELVTQDSSCAPLIVKRITCIFGICPVVLTTRAPPVTLRSIDA